jgi:hypothetical protein
LLQGRSNVRPANGKLKGKEAEMKALAVVLFALALAQTNAAAQTVILPGTVTPPSSVFGSDPMVRITVAFRTSVATPDTQSMSDAKAAETVRRTLYSMAEGECAALSEIFKAECRLNSLLMTNVTGPINPSGVMNATAVYELKGMGQASGR